MHEAHAVAMVELREVAGVVGATDDALVIRASRGDKDAFSLLIEPRTERAVRSARAILGNDAEAREAVQEAFVSTWVNLPKLRDVRRFDAWLNRVLINQCRDALRRRRRSREIILDATDAVVEDPTTASLDTAAVLGAFDRISVEDRHILVLHHLHDFPLEEVARQLQIPVGTAKSRLWSARRSLERALEAEA
jgi:RNA polymerase sigma-70 factor (ECF subfamily)